MKLHYKGKYDLNPESLPHRKHIPNAVKFKEVEDTKHLSTIARSVGISILFIMLFAATMRCGEFPIDGSTQSIVALIFSCLIFFPHEILHAVCYKEDVYLYTNFRQGMLFIMGTESMSKSRFIFMAMLPTIIFGMIPYVVGMLFPQFLFGLVFGSIAMSQGGADYYNVYNALTQVPKGAKIYQHKLNTYWYIAK